jgi:WD40 repeat protein
LYTDLAPYLTHRAADDTSLLTFYHRTSFGQAVGQAYLDEDVREARHRAMASYFAEQPLFRGEDGGRQPNLRKLSEFPYQLAHGHLWDGLQEILTDFDFLQAKVGAVGPQSLIEDYDQANAAGYEERDLPLVRGALQLSTHVLAQDDTQFAGQLVGRLMGQEVPAIQDLVGQAKGWSGAPWLRPLRPSLTPPGGPLSHTLEAHAGSVEALAIFDEGRRAITGAEDATLVIWDLEREGQRWTLKGHGGTVRDVAVFAGGKRALSGSDDKTLRLWDLETGQALQILHGHSDAVSTVAVFAGGERALSGSQDSTLRVWDLGSGELLDTLRGHTHAVNAVAVSADGQRAYSGSSDKTLRIWDLEAGQELRRVECQAGIIEALALFDGDGRAVTASFGQLTVWNLGTGKQDFELDAHLSPVQALAVYKDRSWAVSGSLYGGTIRCWDLNSGEQLFVLEGYLDGVTRIAVSSDGRRLVATGDDGSLRVLALETGDELLHTIRDQDVIAVSRDGQRALCRSRTEDWRLRVFELPSGREVRTIGGHWSDMKHIRFITRAAIFDCGERAVTCASDALKVWDLETGCTIQTLEGHGEWDVWALAVTPDGTRAISGSDDKTLKVWDLKSGEHLHTLKGHKGAVLGVAVIPGVRHAVSASHDGTLKVWNLETGQALQTLEGHRQAVTAVAVSPDGATAVSGSEEGTLKLWDLRSGQSVRSFGGHESGVTAVDVFAGGELAVSASHDSNLKIWDLDRGIAVRTLTAHSDSIDNVTVLSDGRRAVSTSCDHTVRMWNLDAMDASSITRAHNGTVESTTVLANGRRAVSTSSHPTELRAWSMETAGRTPALLWQVGPRDTVKVFSDTGFVVVLPRLSLLEHKTLCVLWNLTDGTRLASVECPFGLTPQWADPQRVLLSVKDRLLVWNRQNGRSLRELKPNASFSSAQINAVAIYAGGKRAISAGADGEFRVWDLESGQGLYAIQAHQDSVTALTVSADSRRAVSASKDSTLCLWNLEKSQIRKVATLSGHRQGVRSIRLFAGDRRAISASDDSTIKIWSLETGNVEYTLNGHTSLITGLRVSADGMWAVSCSWDHTLRLWDLDNRNEVVTFRADAGLVDCDLTPDGRTLLAGDRLGQVHILRLVQVAHSPIVVRASHNGQGMLSVACLRCRASAAIEESDLGKVVTCPDCGAELHVNRLTVNVSNTWLAAEESASEELGGRLRKESEPSDVRAIVAHNLRQYIRSVSALESQEKSTHNKPAADEGHEQPDDK